MSIKGKKSNKNNINKKSKKKSANHSKTIKRILITLCFFGIIAVPVYAYMQQIKAEHDLSVVGNGIPTVVQVHDPGCSLCNRLKNNLSKVKGDFKDKIQFKTANILKKKGKVFAAKYNSQKVTLLYFDKKGERVDTTHGVTSSEDLKTKLQKLANRR